MIGIVLAGGQAARLGGGDKGLHRVGDRPIMARVVNTMRRQCDELILNANGDATRFASFGLPVVADDIADLSGPLAGLLACLDHVAAHNLDASCVVTVPTDTPFLPDDLVARLEDARVRERAAIVCAGSGGQRHYTIALWMVALRHDLRETLVAGGRQVSAFVERHPFAVVDWPALPHDPFFNVNTPADLAEAERIAAGLDPP